MELENESIFMLENLYGEYVDEMLLHLSMHPSTLVDDTATKFQDLIHQHCERVCLSKEFTLPSFGEDGVWLNTARPLDFEGDLKSRVYAMDFFTYCCINCIHILPLLKEVEIEHAQNPAFTIIGVHSPKFPNEKHLERVKDAVIRNNIRHPVLNDPESKLWMLYGITCWPTVFVVGPGHTLLFILVGEAQIDKLSFLCHHVLKYFEFCSVDLDSSPLPILPLEEPKTIETGLLFPGSVTTNGNKCVVVSDTGHNRLLLMSKDLKVQEIVGSGMSGCEDGFFYSASFNAPNGTVFYNGFLYVADTGNHSIRKVDFENKIVTTVFRYEDTKATFQSPWDVCVGPKLGRDLNKLTVLYIAVAGSHQIWALDLDSDPSNGEICVPFAGSGKEENKPNRYRMKAGFAQPSGIAYSEYSPDFLYIADSESSTIKSIDLKNNGAVQVLVGGSRDPSDLFQFGDVDGKYIDVKLQHPMSVCVLGLNILAVADTYNHKIKIIDTDKKTCTTFNTSLKLCEPNSICVIEDYHSNNLKEWMILVADSSNHQIVSVPLFESSLKEVISEPIDLVIESLALDILDDIPRTEFPLAYDGKIFCHFQWNLDSKFKLNPSGSCCDIESEGDGNVSFEFLSQEGAFGSYQPCLKVVSKSKYLMKNGTENHKFKVAVNCHVATCDEYDNLCSFSHAVFKVLINFSESGPKSVKLFFAAEF